MFYRILFIVHYAHRRTIGLQRYYKKCTYASKASNYFQKIIDFIYLHEKPAVRREFYSQTKQRVCHARRQSRFLKIIASGEEYGLHFANVLSRWAREHANEVGAPRRYYKSCERSTNRPKIQTIDTYFYVEVWDCGLEVINRPMDCR